MGTTVRTAVVGLGYFGRFHAKHYAANDRADLVAVCDVDGERARAASGEFGGAPFTDHRELIGKVEAVSIAAPTSNHFEIARDLIAAGIHVLIEKPITPDLASADRLIELADAAGVVLQVGHIERFSAAWRALSEKARRPSFIEARRVTPWRPRATDVGVILDLMIHDIDLVLGLVAAPVERIEASGSAVFGFNEDVAQARLTFADGAVAEITASRVAEKSERRMRLEGAGGHFMCDFAEHRLARYIGYGAAGEAEPVAAESWDIPREDSLANQIAHFVDCVLTGGKPIVDGRAARRALAVATMIGESICGAVAKSPAKMVG